MRWSTEGGERIPYDALVLATGSINRILPMFPPGDGIYYLRTEAEAHALKAHLHRSKSLILIGGGVVGLEIAASAAEIGLKVTVIEIAPRILARVCDAETGAIIHEAPSHARRRHSRRHRGARRCAGCRTAVSRSRPKAARPSTPISSWSAPAPCPTTRLRRRRGSTCKDGIVVDDHGRTADPAIFAAGDCTRFPGPHGPVRLENWRHAQEHGAVAGRNAAGGDVAYTVAPSFWSEQYDLYIQGMGWPAPQPTQRVRRQIGPNAMILFELDGSHLAYAIGINAQRDIAAARRLIERRVPLDAAELADPAKPLNAMLKAKA